MKPVVYDYFGNRLTPLPRLLIAAMICIGLSWICIFAALAAEIMHGGNIVLKFYLASWCFLILGSIVLIILTRKDV